MKHLISLTLLLLLFSCEDTTPPSVSITSVTTGSTVNEIVTIAADADDNEGISKVEFYINDELMETDTESPYVYVWYTTEYDNGTEHTIRVVAYDEMDNSTLDEVSVTVDNSTAVPNGGNVVSVEYNLEEMTVVWEPSTNGDFQDYRVLYSTIEGGDKDTLATYTDISTTSHSITEFDPLVENWFYIQVTDTLGLTAIGTGMTNTIDSPPTASVLNPIAYENGSFMITWSQNNDDDFKSYTLYESESEDMSNQIEIFYTEERTNSYYDLNVLCEQRPYYRVAVSDYWGLKSSSDIRRGGAGNYNMDGFVLEYAGNEVYREFEGAVYGSVSLAVGETLELSVHFLDSEGNLLDVNNCHEVVISGYDASIVFLEVEGDDEDDDHDHDEHGMAIHVEGVSVGSTSFQFQLMFDGHSNYTSMFNIPVTVTAN